MKGKIVCIYVVSLLLISTLFTTSIIGQTIKKSNRENLENIDFQTTDEKWYINITIHRIRQIDEIEPGDEADWRWQVAIKGNIQTDPIKGSYNDKDDITIDEKYRFRIANRYNKDNDKTRYFDIYIHLWERDDYPFGVDDVADISGYPGGGPDNHDGKIPRGAYFYGKADWVTGDIILEESDYLTTSEGWYVTSGEYDDEPGDQNDAEVWFDVEFDTEIKDVPTDLWVEDMWFSTKANDWDKQYLVRSYKEGDWVYPHVVYYEQCSRWEKMNTYRFYYKLDKPSSSDISDDKKIEGHYGIDESVQKKWTVSETKPWQLDETGVFTFKAILDKPGSDKPYGNVVETNEDNNQKQIDFPVERKAKQKILTIEELMSYSIFNSLMQRLNSIK